MTYEQFVREFWGQLKAVAFDPALSVGEVLVLFALVALKIPAWVATPLMFVWILWRTGRDSDTRPKDARPSPITLPASSSSPSDT